jgi:hypothetical protein
VCSGPSAAITKHWRARAAKKSGQTLDQFAATWKVPAKFPGYSAGLGDSLKNDARVIWEEAK